MTLFKDINYLKSLIDKWDVYEDEIDMLSTISVDLDNYTKEDVQNIIDQHKEAIDYARQISEICDFMHSAYLVYNSILQNTGKGYLNEISMYCDKIEGLQDAHELENDEDFDRYNDYICNLIIDNSDKAIVGVWHRDYINRDCIKTYLWLRRYLPDISLMMNEILEFCNKDTSSTESLETSENFMLPAQLARGNAEKIFQAAIKKGYIKVLQSDRLEWLGYDKKGTRAQLSYFCGLAYGYEGESGFNTGGHVPYLALEELFKVRRLDTAIIQVYYAQKPQYWRKVYDELVSSVK